jgi:hypothetical protein
MSAALIAGSTGLGGTSETTTSSGPAPGPRSRSDATKVGFLAEKHRRAICDATRAAAKAGAYETPPRAGSPGLRRTLESLIDETDEGREILADAERHARSCMRRVPDRPISVICDCHGHDTAGVPS